jgi:hypothetical protein
VLKRAKPIRHLRTFELMALALSPKVEAHVKVAGEEIILGRLASTTPGERLTLAKRASQRIAAALLLDRDPRVMQAALANPRMTMASVAGAISDPCAGQALVHAVCRDPRWYAQTEVQAALLRSPHTPFERAMYFIAELPVTVLRDLAEFLSLELQAEVAKELERREDSNVIDIRLKPGTSTFKS